MTFVTDNQTMRRFLLLLLLLSVTGFTAGDPADALAKAREQIAARRYAAAAGILQPALGQAAAIPDRAIRTQALAAIHFYLAVAYSGTGQRPAAKEHLRDYLTLAPDVRSIDATKFDRHFVALFREELSSRAPDTDRFQTYYAEWSSAQPPGLTAENAPLVDRAALHLLGDSAEKGAWAALDSTEDRTSFLDTFWSRRGSGPDASRFRSSFAGRVIFADRTFGAGGYRGAFTDRGKVFILLGEPAFVRRRPISNEDRMWLAEDAMVNGTIEQWLYQGEDLPVKVSTPTLTYRFVTQPGVGHGMLQRESSQAMQVLSAAAARGRTR